jgi:hypothetical protein
MYLHFVELKTKKSIDKQPKTSAGGGGGWALELWGTAGPEKIHKALIGT